MTRAAFEPRCTISFVGLLSVACGNFIEHTVANALNLLWMCSWEGSNSIKVLMCGSALVLLHRCCGYWKTTCNYKTKVLLFDTVAVGFPSFHSVSMYSFALKIHIVYFFAALLNKYIIWSATDSDIPCPCHVLDKSFLESLTPQKKTLRVPEA